MHNGSEWNGETSQEAPGGAERGGEPAASEPPGAAVAVASKFQLLGPPVTVHGIP